MPHQLTKPTNFIAKWAAKVEKNLNILDLACGGGRHGRLYLEAGHQVTFLDRNITGLDDLKSQASATVIGHDLEGGVDFPFPKASFDLVIVVNYLWREINDDILDAIKPEGLLLYETFATGNEKFGKPSNPNFLLKSGELLDLTRGKFEVLDYSHGYQDTPSPAIKQHIAARRI